MIRAVRFISIVLVLFASLFGAPIVHAANCTGTGQLSISMAPCPASTFVKFGTSGSISSVATLQGSIPGEVYIEALPSTAIFSTSGFSANFISANRLQVTFYTLSTNSTGVHTGSIDLKICSDPHCRDVLTETQLLYKVSVVVPPTVLQLSPGSVKVGASAFTLKLLGGGFASGSVIHFGDKALTTKFISGSELTARVDLSSATSGHSYKVWVVPPPGNFASNVVLFRLLNPVPSAAQVSPATAMFGVISVPFTVTGTGFVPGSRILFNGTIWPTTFVSKTELMATVDFAEIFPTLVGGIYNVTVQSPAPGGGTSGNLTFTLNNYTPAITSLSPSSEPIVAFGEIVMINGSGFQFNSVVQLNGVTFSSAYISPTQLELELPGNAFTTGADLPVTVTNPSPGGGTSNSAILEIDNPAPSLHWISPVQAYAGSGDMVLTVRASNLNSATQLEWNGVPLQGMAVTNNFIGQFVQATIPAADLATAGSATVALVTPGPGGGTSQTTFTVTVHPPEIDSLNPGFIAPGSGDFTLSLYGQDFDPSAAVYWNSDQLAITQISSGQIQVTVPAAEVMTAGVAKLTVVNPDAAGGTSVPASFAVDASGTSIQALAQPVNDIEWDPRQFTLYGTTHSADANYPHDIVSIDPVAVGIVASTGTSPTVEGRQLSLSKDGTMLYVGLIAPWGVERVAMPGFTYAGNLPIFSGGSQAVVASGVQASPLYSHVAAVTILSNGLASSNQGATVFDDTDAVRYFSQNETWDAMAWSADGLSLYGGDTLDSPKSFMSGAYSLTATGTIPIQSTGGLWAGGPMHVDLGSGLVYADGSANVIDPVGGAVAASYPVSGVMVPDSSLGCAYFIYQTEAQAGTSDWTLACYSTTDQTLTRSIAIPSLNGAPTKMMRWGNEGLAFITDGGYIYFVSGQVVTGN